MRGIFLLSLALHFCNGQIASLSHGQILGFYSTALNGKQIEVYKKIPFAKPPTDELRFAKPQPVDDWNGVLNGREYSAACPSNSSRTTSPQKHIDEDCLYLNIFTTTECKISKACPVIVYVHGGNLLFDSAVMFPDESLIEKYASKNMVFVIPAFRLGTLGLFTTPYADIVPTNLVLYDFELALKFVHAEVGAFGGNNSRITTMGHSSGADMSLAIALSKNANEDAKLVQQAIAMSANLDFRSVNNLVEESFFFASEIGCVPKGIANFGSRETTQHIVNCLRRKSLGEILHHQRALENANINVLRGFALAEPISSSGNLHDFLQNTPMIPVLSGATLHEFDHISFEQNFLAGRNLQLRNNREIQIKWNLDMQTGTLNTTHGIDSQTIFVSTFLYTANQAKKRCPAYLYSLDMKYFNFHATELCFFMGIHCRPEQLRTYGLNNSFVQYLTNFADSGRPFSEWNKLDFEEKNYWKIDSDETGNIVGANMPGYHETILAYWQNSMTFFDDFVSSLKVNLNKKL